MNPIMHISFLPSITLLLSAVLISGCSSSGDSPSLADTQDETSAVIEPGTNDVDSLSDDDVSNDVAVIIDSTSDTAGEPMSNTSNALEQESVSTDPMIQNRTLVNFEITVPVYQSNALQVALTWGDVQASAAWIGDELWSLSLDFPSDTEQLLTIVFTDDNGNIELGSYEQSYRTGFNDAESLQITADQFDTERWDADQDGVSNIEELSLGTAPLEASGMSLEDALIIPFFNATTEPGAMYYEPEVKSLILPADIQETLWVDDLPFSSENTVTNITLTELGNGTYSRTYERTRAQDITYYESSIASRSSQDGTVSWSGMEIFTGSLAYYGAGEHTFETVSTFEGITLVQRGNGTLTSTRSSSGTGRADIVTYNYRFILNLDSIDEFNTCSILHGTANYSYEQNIEPEQIREFTVSRNPTGESWDWRDTLDGETSTGSANAVSHRLYCDF